MNKSTFPLTREMQGEAVADLLAGLKFLLQKRVLELNKGERQDLEGGLRLESASNVYKGATSRLMALFQEQRQLQPTSRGDVDEATANEINNFLRKFGVLDEQGDGWTQVIAALHAQGQTLSAINLGTDHLASIDKKIVG